MLKSNSFIDKALLKNYYNNFSFHILKYCEISNPVERVKWEQYYIDLINLKYNRRAIKFKYSYTIYKIINLIYNS